MNNRTLPPLPPPATVVRLGGLGAPFYQPIIVFIVSMFLLLPGILRGQGEVVPRHPFAIELPELGRMTCEECGFGRGLYPVGDTDGDGLSDFLATAIITDTGGWGSNGTELRLYKGVRGGVPSIDVFTRISPTEIGTVTTFRAAGDFDGDSHADLLTSIEDLVFTSSLDYHPTRLVVWWGNSQGEYSLQDTTWLENGEDMWLGPIRVLSMDFNRDGADDLFFLDWAGYTEAGDIVELAGIPIYLGGVRERWGRDRSARESWLWWGPPKLGRYLALARRFQIIDHDLDGREDLVLYEDAKNNLDAAWVKVIYGREDVLLDTTNIVEIDLRSSNGRYALYSDITGDRIPELLVATGGDETLRAYVGFKGQRIDEQYGSGDDPAPGGDVWWGKPWAVLPLPGQLHSEWAASGWGPIFDFGDAGLDGVSDLWVESAPDIIFYNGGVKFDSLYDGWIGIPCGGGSLAQLGDIDGSGLKTIAIGYQCGSTAGVKFIHPSDGVPTTVGRARLLPPGTGRPMTDVKEADGVTEIAAGLGLRVIPNPSSGEVRIVWGGSDRTPATVRITDMLGRDVLTHHVPAGRREFLWDPVLGSHEGVGGSYFITITLNGQQRRSETNGVILRP